MYTRVQLISAVFSLTPALARLNGANMFKFRMNNANFWRDGGRLSIVNSYMDVEMCVDKSCDLSNCIITDVSPWCVINVLLDPNDYILQVFGLQNAYTAAGKDALVDLEWMPPTGCDYMKCSDSGEHCERITGADMPWFPIEQGAMPPMECSRTVLAEVAVVTSLSKPFCFLPTPYLGRVGDCWLTHAAEAIVASEAGSCFGEWDVNGATLGNVYSARESSSSSLTASKNPPKLSIDANGKCARTESFGGAALNTGKVFLLPFEEGSCSTVNNIPHPCRVAQEPEELDDASTDGADFSDYARIYTFNVNQDTSEVSSVDVIPVGSVGFVSKGAHHGDHSYRFTRVSPDAQASTVIDLPNVPFAADQKDPGTVLLWLKKSTGFTAASPREALLTFHHVDVEANVGKMHIIDGIDDNDWALSMIELGLGGALAVLELAQT